jgi:hypothetical protein
MSIVNCLYFLDSSNQEDQVPAFISPRNRVAQLYPREMGSAGLLQLIYDRQSVGQSVLVSGAHLGPVTNFSFSLKFLLDSCGFVIL